MSEVLSASISAPLTNRRDLGGVPIGVARMRVGVLWRSDDVSIVPDAEANALVAEGLTTVIDLRSRAEADHTGRGPLGRLPVAYRRLPLTRGGGTPGEFARHLADGTDTPELVGRWYASTVAAEAEHLVEGYRLIAESSGAVLVHCTAGKDRTGLFIGTLLALLGAESEAIAADYARSAEALPALMQRVTDSIGHLLGGGVAHFRAAIDPGFAVSPLVGAHADSMHAMLRVIETEHGGIRTVLAQGGLDAALERRLAERLLEA